MQEEVLIKSKERVHRFAEVFTPSRVVRRLCQYATGTDVAWKSRLYRML